MSAPGDPKRECATLSAKGRRVREHLVAQREVCL